jgi:uncharacterized protein (DUF1800 family)
MLYLGTSRARGFETRTLGNARPLGGVRNAALLGLCLLAGCGGGGSESAAPGPGPVPPPTASDVPESDEAAAYFLTQASFGPTADEIARLRTIGYTAWLDEQRALDVSTQRPELEGMVAAGATVFQNQRMERWWHNALREPDQLRQRVAWALSQVLVVSDRPSGLANDPIGLAEYYDMLSRHAFGNYRDLLGEVARSPQMGIYLSHIKNEKPDEVLGIRPDENFSREIMQLFSIGLVELNPDGTPRLDAQGDPLPTYGQPEIEGLAHALTGWNYAGASSWDWSDPNYLPMENWAAYHDFGEKAIVGGAVLPAGQDGVADLEAALDVLFNHPNVGPFLGRQLIQRLVMSNPSPQYVARVAAAFADNGEGVRGDLWATVRAVIMDEEARELHAASEEAGKLREPLLRLSAIWRAFDAYSGSGEYRVWNPEEPFGQGPLRAPSVFNFYRPDFELPGQINDGIHAPEFQISTESQVTLTTNELRRYVFDAWAQNPYADEHTILLDLSDEIALAHDPEALVDHLDTLLMFGTMSPEMRAVLQAVVAYTDYDYGALSGKPAGLQRVQEAIYLLVTSPEGAVQF